MLLLHGMFRPDRFLDLLIGYVAFARAEDGLVKRIAKPHQYFAVSEAVGKTIEAVRGDGRAGVVWHTQGSGKSMEMELYANQVLTHPSLGNPTIVVLTDRTDLDDQLYDTFEASDLLPEKPVQIGTRDELRDRAGQDGSAASSSPRCRSSAGPRRSGRTGPTHPLLSDRRNIIVIVDEAHRSHYDDLDGYARHLRRRAAARHVHRVHRHADLGSRPEHARRLRRLHRRLRPDPGRRGRRDRPGLLRVPADRAQPARGRGPGGDRRARRRGHRRPGRLRARAHPAARRRDERACTARRTGSRTLSEDIVAHWEARRREMRKFIGVPGKGMIVCATREICADLYEQIIAIKPDWHSDDIDKGKIKVVYTGDADRRGADPGSTSAGPRRTRSSSSAPRTPTTSWSWSSSSRCGSPASTRRRCTPCTSTSRCAARRSCRPWPGSTAPSATSRTACSSATPR